MRDVAVLRVRRYIYLLSPFFFFFFFFFPCNQVWLHLSMFLIVSSL